MSDFAQNGDDVIPRIAGGDPKGLRGGKTGAMVDWTTDTKRGLDRLLGLANTNPFVTIEGPGSLAARNQRRSAARSASR
jgi:hypothetical protein